MVTGRRGEHTVAVEWCQQSTLETPRPGQLIGGRGWPRQVKTRINVELMNCRSLQVMYDRLAALRVPAEKGRRRDCEQAVLIDFNIKAAVVT
ncbi:hypothetical protein E2C01_013202 [Portunus trituberculatus]|uniref:Uncharacterized protein n=1 Tax=Portunus trituberculatus TaxID=210409 RepID=A0A5B7DGH0_PORTR|nr:hypothetical protein [Portunus trituberculatus]